ncbi:hypothetical protein [Dactylosporangium fulvum]|uniref:Prevent-host-death family protein n=1 Tax=Dactylosporangium fulvum TaxID=53359 RepID=A0ABY5W0V2_9ACTN|nr:hypothetical protein [Dactylosporangium fulvum]UWP83015.1 hypothetical protein Dfulv_01525 [Dactylosporangium fulvum]
MANFSDLLQRPNDTLASLRSGRHIRLRRRDAEDIVVTTASRHEQEREVVKAAIEVLAYLAEADPVAAGKIAAHAFPWLRLLPDEDLDAFLDEFLGILRAGLDLDNFGPVWQLIIEWKHTAEVHADPELVAILKQPAEDHGTVPEPVVGK